MKKVIIIGGGAAGMAAAVFAAEAGLAVELFEKNEKLGKKLYITGKGRCNFTNVCTPDEFLENVVSNPKFMYSSISRFTSRDAVALFERLGLRTKTERGRRAFPASDHSSDVIKALAGRMKTLGVKVRLNTEIRECPMPDENTAVIVATGGLSYPSTGSTGDGYRFAERTGHRVSKTFPALVPLITKEGFVPEMQGLSLKNVRLTFKKGKKKLFSEFGELLFTHCGISGPLALSASSFLTKILSEEELTAELDLKPALQDEQIRARLLREKESSPERSFKNMMGALLPSKMVPVFVKQTGIDPDRKAKSLDGGWLEKTAGLLRSFRFTVTAAAPYTEAVITQGGVSVKDIDPKTMESKVIPGLYFAGEVLDVDALTGGYNLQIAWSTAFAAASAIAEK